MAGSVDRPDLLRAVPGIERRSIPESQVWYFDIRDHYYAYNVVTAR